MASTRFDSGRALGIAFLTAAVSVAVAAPWPGPDGGVARADRMAALPIAVRVGMSDAVVVGRVEKVTALGGGAHGAPASLAEVRVTRMLKGKPSGAVAKIGFSEDERHGTFHVVAGKDMVFMLIDPLPGEAYFRLADHWDGAFDAGAASTKEVEVAGRRRDGARDNPGGLRATLVSDRDAYRAGEAVDLTAVVRNRTGAEVKLHRVAWPRAAATRADLLVTIGGRTVAPRPHPTVTDAEIESYFSSRTPWEHGLMPGMNEVLRLDRINTAEKGWGYKEELGFRYYPMEAPGEYSIQATVRNLVPGGTDIVTGVIDVRVTK